MEVLKTFLLALTFVLTFSGCSTPAVQYTDRPVFPHGEYNALQKADLGNGEIRGQAFLRTIGGDVRLAAGYTAGLYPWTSYAENFWSNVVVNKLPIKRKTLEQSKIIDSKSQTTTCDAEGNFVFSNVTDGEYYIAIPVIWKIPVDRLMEEHGAWLFQKVKVDQQHQKQEFVLSASEDNYRDPNFGSVPVRLAQQNSQAPVAE